MNKDAQIAELKAENVELKKHINFLTDAIALLKQNQFGRSSEKTIVVDDNSQLSFFNEAENEHDLTLPEPELEEITYKRKKQKGKREKDLSGLPVEQIICELSENARICPACEGEMHECGRSVYRRELTVIPVQYKVTEYVQIVYSCRNCDNNGIETPMLKSKIPAPLIPNSGVASPSLVAHIANQKYTLAIPLYRQEQDFQRNEINISRQTMANWLIYISQNYLYKFVDELKRQLLFRDVLHADETVLRVLRDDGKPITGDCRMWVYRTSCDTKKHIIIYEYCPNRKYENAQIFLENWLPNKTKYLHSDGYGAYQNLPGGVVNAGCWAHVRRKFMDILKSLPEHNKAGSVPAVGIDFCNKLFALEREYEKFSNLENDKFNAIFEARQKRSKPIMDKFFKWAENNYGVGIATPRSAIGKALFYAINQRKHLENVLVDGRFELSNNRAERAVKPFATGRKNWLFCNTVNGAKASAAIYSVIETAKENGLKPYEYLKFLLENVTNIDWSDCGQVEKLLPWNAPPVCRSDKQLTLNEVSE